jgi:hypothetical protein
MHLLTRHAIYPRRFPGKITPENKFLSLFLCNFKFKESCITMSVGCGDTAFFLFNSIIDFHELSLTDCNNNPGLKPVSGNMQKVKKKFFILP